MLNICLFDKFAYVYSYSHLLCQTLRSKLKAPIPDLVDFYSQNQNKKK